MYSQSRNGIRSNFKVCIKLADERTIDRIGFTNVTKDQLTGGHGWGASRPQMTIENQESWSCNRDCRVH